VEKGISGFMKRKGILRPIECLPKEGNRLKMKINVCLQQSFEMEKLGNMCIGKKNYHAEIE